MYILKNAWIAIKRNKGRNILLGIIIMVIASALTVTLAINNTSDKLIEAYENANEIIASISFNRGNMMDRFNPENAENFESMREEFESIASLTIEDIENYGNSKYVKDYYYTARINVDSDLEAASSDFDFTNRGNGGGERPNSPNNNSDFMANANFTLMGYSSLSAMQEFIDGSYTMSDASEDVWDKILDGNYCLINSELATLNEIEVGDGITLVDPEDEDVTYTLTVLGIYKENSNEEEMTMFSASANTFITNTNVVKNVSSEKEVNVTPYFTLTNIEVLEDFTAELSSKGLNENYQVTTNEEEIKEATSSIKNVGTFATTFMIITLIIGAMVLVIINSINIRERKYEIGVLRTIGMKKINVALQFGVELMVVAVVGLILGAGIGASLSKPISNSLLASEIENAQNDTENIQNNFGGMNGNRPNMSNINFNQIGGVKQIQAYTKVDAIVDFKVVAELLALGLLLTIISSLVSVVNIVRFKPLDILKERT